MNYNHTEASQYLKKLFDGATVEELQAVVDSGGMDFTYRPYFIDPNHQNTYFTLRFCMYDIFRREFTEEIFIRFYEGSKVPAEDFVNVFVSFAYSRLSDSRVRVITQSVFKHVSDEIDINKCFRNYLSTKWDLTPTQSDDRYIIKGDLSAIVIRESSMLALNDIALYLVLKDICPDIDFDYDFFEIVIYIHNEGLNLRGKKRLRTSTRDLYDFYTGNYSIWKPERFLSKELYTANDRKKLQALIYSNSPSVLPIELRCEIANQFSKKKKLLSILKSD